MYLVFDTETTGLPRDFNAPITDIDNWPRVVQLAWQLHDEAGELISQKDYIIKPNGFNIPFESERVHGISTELALAVGEELSTVLTFFIKDLEKANFMVGHNLKFDVNVLGCEFIRLGQETPLNKPVLDTCTERSALLCQIPGGRGGKFKLPTLTEIHQYLFGESFNEAHNATADVEATSRCFLELLRKAHYTLEEILQEPGYFESFQALNPKPIQKIGLHHVNLKAQSEQLRVTKRQAEAPPSQKLTPSIDSEGIVFAHLHNHTQYSILQSTAEVGALLNKAVALGQPAVALTDTGNMMAAFQFEKLAAAHNEKIRAEKAEAEQKGEPFDGKEILPIIGCEFNVCRDHQDKSIKDNGYQIVCLAKNKNGYQNLIKLASIAYTKGMYYVPRIDKKVLTQYKEDLIILSGNLYGEIPNLLLNVGERQAEEALLWWKAAFGSDFYIEVGRHGLEVEERLNPLLIDLASKHELKLIATNNTYYIEQKDAIAHDVLLCVKDNELVETPKGRGRGFRYGLENDSYYMRSTAEMLSLFSDLPEAITNVAEIIAKCEHYGLAREVLLPAFDIPTAFIDPQDALDGGKRGENAFLRHLSYEGAKKRYYSLTDEITERLDFELATIEKTGYPGYFLIVQDFCNAARQMGVSVGPGRGSAAGSAVAYCIGITNVDPIKYDLLFERFLNPDRVSMPDIDIDFDDEGRGRVIDYVINKYGANQVAQIITYGTMAAKSAIRDTARVMNLPLPEADRLAKLIPDLSLKKLFNLPEPELIDKLRNQEAISNAKELRRIYQGSDLQAKVLQKAMEIEGSVRNTGIHACGVIITPDDLTNFVPVATAKDSEMVCTQYDNAVAESAGLLKMDFLGLKTLTLIKDAVRLVKENHGIELDPDTFPIDDEATYALFQRGETVGIFQYESPGMQKHLKELKPTVFADLIAMNALYRPGPMEYIPSYCKRKHGDDPIIYDLPDCEEYLNETYGITVYQEQVMLLSQKLADFTKGEADTLRKAMGKKDRKVLDKMKPTFIERASTKGHPAPTLEKIWKDWEAFASYAFNKSHSTCYAWIAYQTAYLKANYPAEYMASVLSNNMSDIKQVSFFMEECRRMGVEVLGPDINESGFTFAVNSSGAIRFGLGAIRGMGSGPVDAIIEERKNNGPFASIFDLTKRINLRVCNRRSFESLVFAGGFDSFADTHRAQYFVTDSNGRTFLEAAIRYGASIQEQANSSQHTMFGEATGTTMPAPIIPRAEEWPAIYKLNREKEVVGIFISGHPLDDYKVEISSFCTGTVAMLNDPSSYQGRDLLIAAVISNAEHRSTKRGDAFGSLFIEDYQEAFKLNLFNETYLKFKHFMEPGTFVAIKGRIEVPRFRQYPEFVVHHMELLQELRDKRAKMLKLRFTAKQLDQIVIEQLHELFEANPGSCQLHFTVFDPLDGIEVSLPSRSVKVQPSSQLFKELAKLDIQFKLN
jgi:DNA polymerase-3 subunit alpha